MAKNALLSEDELVGFTDGASEEQLNKLTAMGRELYGVDAEMAELADRIEQLKARKNEITMKELPDFMKSIGQDKMGLPEFDVDLVLEPFYYAAIKAEWEPERREAAFKYLEDTGNGSLIKLNLTFAFARGQLADARSLQAMVELIRRVQAECGIEVEHVVPEPTLRTEVHFSTLTAFVREQVEAGNPIDLEVLGATVGSIVKLKPRKGEKKRKK